MTNPDPTYTPNDGVGDYVKRMNVEITEKAAQPETAAAEAVNEAVAAEQAEEIENAEE
ncbi:MAG: hypothetical protein OEQ39_03025 [Gammaproteobacteria bacterium]|nr:hypothetical protein [Gammaproteobacteria bacterium]MDH3375923.1 hypothetical protein [Gammaproteobacteria bacterium]